MQAPNKPLDRVTLLNVTIFVEAFLLLAATIWSGLENLQLLPLLHLDWKACLWGAGVGIIMALIGLLVVWLGKKLPLFASLRSITLEQIAPLFVQLTWFDLLLVAAISGFCEEILFRGVAQHQLGLTASSLVFGVFHCPSWRFISYGLWVTAGGFILGLLFQHTNNLWAPILAHALSNAISLCALHFMLKHSDQDHQQREDGI